MGGDKWITAKRKVGIAAILLLEDKDKEEREDEIEELVLVRLISFPFFIAWNSANFHVIAFLWFVTLLNDFKRAESQMNGTSLVYLLLSC